MPIDDRSAEANGTVLVMEADPGLRRELRRALDPRFRLLEAPRRGSAALLDGADRVEIILTTLDGTWSEDARVAAPHARLLRLWDGSGPAPVIAKEPGFIPDLLRLPAGPEEIRLRVEAALVRARMEREIHRLRLELRDRCSVESLLGASPGMERLRETIMKVAPESTTVLIRGERGSGRRTVARAIHHGSPRSAGPFVTMAPSAIPGGRAERELLDGTGRLAEARGGTLFIDGLEDLSKGTRTALFEQRDAPEDSPRLIAASLIRPAAESAGHRLAREMTVLGGAVRMEIPPLRERRGDLPMLASSFLARAAEQRGVPPKSIGPDALTCLEAYPWPGNLRELEHLMESLSLLVASPGITPDHLPEHVRMAPLENALVLPTIPEEGFLWQKQIESFERGLLEQALTLSDGRKVTAARRLGLKKEQMKYLCRKYGL